MFWRKRSAEDFAEEIKAHLEFEAKDLKREGLSEDEASRKARCESRSRCADRSGFGRSTSETRVLYVDPANVLREQ